MSTLMQASYEFMNRPQDERFTSLLDLHAFTSSQHDRSKQAVMSSRKLQFAPTDDNKGIVAVGNHSQANPTHWSFSQLSQLAGVPADLLRTQCEKSLAPLAADNLNAGMAVIRDVKEVGVLLRDETSVPVTTDANGINKARFDLLPSPKLGNQPLGVTLAAATGPNYGRIWNSEVTKELVKRFGNGVNDTSWTVPGMFGKALENVTKENTTLFASDRDMFVFLADEANRITIPNRRGGEQGSLARGFFIYNSEVGSKTLGLAFFLFDYVCCNRIVWGVQEFEKIAIRHTSGAPDRWLEEIVPTLKAYHNSSASPVEAKLIGAQNAKLDAAEEFLMKRFTKKQVELISIAHIREEERPIETLWDCTVAVTAYAKTIANNDTRVELEREAGRILELAPSEYKTSKLSLNEAF